VLRLLNIEMEPKNVLLVIDIISTTTNNLIRISVDTPVESFMPMCTTVDLRIKIKHCFIKQIIKNKILNIWQNDWKTSNTKSTK